MCSKAFGRLDVLVNNAGFGHVAPFEQATEEDFRAQIDTNFYGVVNLTRAALPVMRRQRSGHIINISSVGGLTEVLAQEVAPLGIKIVSVEPGGMRTNWGEIARGQVPGILPDYMASV